MRNPPRILVVDDNPTNVEILRVRLDAQGYEVVTAADGEEALTQARALEPDLVLLDVMMPKLDGISVLKELKQDAKLQFVPVILVTAKADPRDVVAGARGRRRRLSHQAVRAGRAGGARALDAAHQGSARHRAAAGRQAQGADRGTVDLEPGARGAGRRAARRDRPHRPAAALPGAAGGAADRLRRRRRDHAGEPPPRGHRGVLRPARLHRLHRAQRARGGDGGAARVPREPRRADLPLRGHARPLRRRRHHDRVQRSDPVRRPHRARRPARARDARRRSPGCRRNGSARATGSASASASRRAMRRSARSASSSAANTPRSAASSISPRGCATRRARARS